MDPCEALAREHLLGRGYQDVAYEPDGKVPPDFVVDGRIAVEVRRLNENERDATHPRGLNLVATPLVARVQSLCRAHGAADTAAWWVNVRFRRPVPPRERLLVETRTFLDRVRQGTALSHVAIDNVALEAIPRPDRRGKTFELGVTVDEDSDGGVLDELERNLRLIIRHKSVKVARVRSKYPVWWLLLVDHVGNGLGAADQAEFKRRAQIAHDWDKIILINPRDDTDSFEL
jgi:hypothetical protein